MRQAEDTRDILAWALDSVLEDNKWKHRVAWQPEWLYGVAETKCKSAEGVFWQPENGEAHANNLVRMMDMLRRLEREGEGARAPSEVEVKEYWNGAVKHGKAAGGS